MDNATLPLLLALGPRWVVAVIALCVGLSAALVAWLVSRAAAAVPAQDRIWLDAPPAGYRIVWWPVHWLAHYLRALLPKRAAEAGLARLRLAGLDYALDAAQFLAGRLVWALLCGGFAAWLAARFAVPLAWPSLAGTALGFVLPRIWLHDCGGVLVLT